VAERVDLSRGIRRVERVEKLFQGEEFDLGRVGDGPRVQPDGLQQVGLAQAGGPVDEQRIVDGPRGDSATARAASAAV
jgi:hypothetical protein